MTGGFGDTIVVSGSGFGSDSVARTRSSSLRGRFAEPSARRVIVPFARLDDGASRHRPGRSVHGKRPRRATSRRSAVFAVRRAPPGSSLERGCRSTSGSRTGEVGKSFFSGTEYEFSITAGASDRGVSRRPLQRRGGAEQRLELYLLHHGAELRPPSRRAGPRRRAAASIPPPRKRRGKTPASPPRIFCGNAGSSPARVRAARRRGDTGDPRAGGRGGPFVRRDAPARASPPARAPTEHFKVLDRSLCALTIRITTTTVTANLKFDGEHTLLYVDAKTPPDVSLQRRGPGPRSRLRREHLRAPIGAASETNRTSTATARSRFS